MVTFLARNNSKLITDFQVFFVFAMLFVPVAVLLLVVINITKTPVDMDLITIGKNSVKNRGSKVKLSKTLFNQGTIFFIFSGGRAVLGTP